MNWPTQVKQKLQTPPHTPDLVDRSIVQVCLAMALLMAAAGAQEKDGDAKSRFNRILAEFGFSDTNIASLSPDPAQAQQVTNQSSGSGHVTQQ